ncbi:MAG: hypothetical protein CM1200mP40_07150 [Gammaproteobacteria bacterium]|nr:MAG: hypothetical protein CM1200mP40_07150 [Gammaproteobacteria bacterium]
MDLESVQKLDEEDPLAEKRKKFLLPKGKKIFLDGNSLGPLTLVANEGLSKLSTNNGAMISSQLEPS